MSAASFSIPQIGQTGMLLWAYVSYTLLGLAYSMVNIPYGSLAGAMTQVSSERAKLAGARTIGAVTVGSLLGIFIAPRMVHGVDLQPLFTTMTLIFVVIGAALYLFTALSTRERVVREVPKVSFKQSLATLKGNKPLLMLCVSSFLFLTGQLAVGTVQIYYFRDVLHALPLYAALSIVNIVLTFGMGSVLSLIVRKLGKKKTYVYSGLVMVAGGLIVFFAPANVVPLAFVGVVITQFGILMINMLVWALEADTVEYGEWKTHVRTEGITYALFSFTRKTGQAVGGALAAYALAWGGYAAGAGVQTAEATLGIRAGAGLLPAAFGLLAIAVMLAYPLTDARHKDIVAEITARRAAKSASAPVDGDYAADDHGAGDPSRQDLPTAVPSPKDML
ncbi:glycoside-pentoside-hexuronide (GPH):cation symporter [Paenarthrobacter sp. Z7-10]|uniref:glycoside-pentoside-hexuronide (GPH):cation symporter n=1 Tax=Paenarthrobacter sp. Z7-10 TaxID=2787635 RepID=UPI0022A912EA|nr:glycoside-pentoside-hexuronide (GPH):cation symporter [Paenarthrobacter sp. Z7-10]